VIWQEPLPGQWTTEGKSEFLNNTYASQIICIKNIAQFLAASSAFLEHVVEVGQKAVQRNYSSALVVRTLRSLCLDVILATTSTYSSRADGSFCQRLSLCGNANDANTDQSIGLRSKVLGITWPAVHNFI
jgi:hypothetical protein